MQLTKTALLRLLRLACYLSAVVVVVVVVGGGGLGYDESPREQFFYNSNTIWGIEWNFRPV